MKLFMKNNNRKTKRAGAWMLAASMMIGTIGSGAAASGVWAESSIDYSEELMLADETGEDSSEEWYDNGWEDIEPEPETETDSEPGSEGEPDPGTDSEADPGTGSETDPGTDSEPGSETNPGTGSETDPGTGSETDPAATELPDSTADSSAISSISDPDSLAESVVSQIEVQAGVLSDSELEEFGRALEQISRYGIISPSLTAAGTVASNMAVLNIHSASAFQAAPNLCGKGELPYVIADAEGQLTLPSVVSNPVFHIPSAANDHIVVENEENRAKIKKIYETEDELYNEVNALIGKADSLRSMCASAPMSSSLAVEKQDDTHYTLNTTSLGGSVIVLDLAPVTELVENGSLSIRKTAAQTLVLRNSTGFSKIAKMNVDVDGSAFSTEAGSFEDANSSQNSLLRKYAVSDLIWDLGNSYETVLESTAGTFLTADGARVMINAVSSGTIAGGAAVIINGGGGWQYLGVDDFDAPLTATLSVKKEAAPEGTEVPVDAFSFSLTPITENAPMPETDGQTASNGQNGSATFGSIDFTDYPEGNYQYQISENALSEAMAANWTTGDPVYAQVTVANGLATAKYFTSSTFEGEGTDMISIVNQYNADPGTESTPEPEPTPEPEDSSAVKVKIPVVKNLEIKDGFSLETEAQNEEFEFVLTPLTEGRDADEQTLKVKTDTLEGENNQKSGRVEFAELSFDEEGTYEYEISETAGSHPGYTYDDAVYYVVVNVTELNENGTEDLADRKENSDAEYKAEVSYKKTVGEKEEEVRQVEFTNRYAPAAIPAEKLSGLLQAEKYLQVKAGCVIDETCENDTDFEIIVTDPDKKETTTVISTLGLKLIGNESTYRTYYARKDLPLPSFTKPGVYQFSVHEEDGGQTGYQYDASEYQVSIKVVDNGGVLEAKKSDLVIERVEKGENKKVSKVEFVNRYAPAAIRFDLPVIKQIEGDGEKTGTYEFWLTRGSLAGRSEELDAIEENAEGKYSKYQLKKLTIDGEGKGSFPLSFGAPGTYTYYINERARQNGSENAIPMIYDDSEYRVIVKITDKGGVLEKNVSCTKKNISYTEAIFTNRYAYGSFTFYKVRYENPEQGVRDATYGIYGIKESDRNSDEYQTTAGQLDGGQVNFDRLTKIGTQVSESNGRVFFEKLAPNSYYVIKEEEAPGGYQNSKNAIVIHTEYVKKDNRVITTMTSGGNGTASVDSHGMVKWFEHRIRLKIYKKTSGGTMLAGAKMMLVDKESGTTIDKWISSADDAHEVLVKLALGHEYEIVEFEAPKGYQKAENKTVKIEDVPCGSEDYIQYVTIVDPASGTANGGSGGSGGSGSDAERANGSRTGDSNPILPYALALAAAAAAIAAILKAGKKKK